MTIRTSKTIINIGLVSSLILSITLLFTNLNILHIDQENYQISNRILFFLALFLFQIRFFYLINFVKKNRTTHQVVSRLKKPYLADALTGIFLFCILPIVLTILNIYFNQSLNFWFFMFFLLYIVGTGITLISEYQRRKWKVENKTKLNLYTDGLFKYARYINYFGETISQPSLWFLATGIWWISLIAFLYQLYDFLFVHIPKREKYILSKYGESFNEISKVRNIFIPFVY